MKFGYSYYCAYISSFTLIMLPLYLKSNNLLSYVSLCENIRLFSTYFCCSTVATCINISYVVIIVSLINRFDLYNSFIVRIWINLQNNTIIYTKIIAWKVILIMCNIKLGYIGYSLFLASLYCDLYISYFICISYKYRYNYLMINQYTNDILANIRLSFYLHNKYCIEQAFTMFFYCVCDEWILLMFDYANNNLTKIMNFNFRVLEDFINTVSITFIFQYNIMLFLLQILYLVFLHNYIKKRYY